MAETIGIDEFRRAMRALPAQVCIIASRSDDLRIAMTATAVTSLSAEPPQLLICVHHQSRTAAVIREARAFSVNLVPASLVDAATQCALVGLEPEERFRVGRWQPSTSLEQPLLEDALVGFECSLTSDARHGTHHVLTGLIHQVRFSEGRPLLYHDASYREIGARLDAIHLGWDTAIQGF
ncbi:flavin reductase domain protein FMN-binding protein [Rhizobium sp. CF080]|uniref:flavin reductase family protein n=1 Tax=Rhizobium sp. (strain CF080) TaxID=1144310 RepID=UPI0003E7DC62|nr:flavin reductase family protein [Rhizobium sp. CF080]EUB98165.1 flavin reductase domain protein FMN-binding protein [Rhizobium sp. CF080]